MISAKAKAWSAQDHVGFGDLVIGFAWGWKRRVLKTPCYFSSFFWV